MGGNSFQPQTQNNASTEMNAYNSAVNNPAYQGLSNSFAQGGMSNAQALQALQGINQSPSSSPPASGSSSPSGGGIMGGLGGVSGLFPGSSGSAPQNPGPMPSPNAGAQATENWQNAEEAYQTAQQNQANNPNYQAEANDLATGATTGSQFATNAVEGNSLLMGGLQNMQGAYDAQANNLQNGLGLEGQQSGILSGLQSQGFNLQPQDQSLYGQEAGQIASQYGQQGNDIANSLASRGLSDSGAAGAQFSGLMGTQNQQLAAAQQQIAQQRFQNTQNQIAQQQQFVGQLQGQNTQAAGSMGQIGGQEANQAATDINQQYGRQLTGAQNATGNINAAGSLQNQANSTANSANAAAAQLQGPGIGQVLGGLATGGISNLVGGIGTGFGMSAGKSLFGSPAPTQQGQQQGG